MAFLKSSIKFTLPPTEKPKPQFARLYDGDVTEPCKQTKHNECMLSTDHGFVRCGCWCHTIVMCKNNHEGGQIKATVTLESTDENKWTLVYLCQDCFDLYVTIQEDGLYVIDHSIRDGEYDGQFFIGGDAI